MNLAQFTPNLANAIFPKAKPASQQRFWLTDMSSNSKKKTLKNRSFMSKYGPIPFSMLQLPYMEIQGHNV